MRILLFDDINTVQARRSLVRALTSLGHEVITTDRFSRSHTFHEDQDTIDFIWKQVHDAIDQKPDVLLNFRPPTLLPEMVKTIQKAGIFTLAWFTDDPVLYKICYQNLVEVYDFVLHAGGENVISFYQERHGISGVNFPFWTDDEEYQYIYDADNAEYDIAFLGHCVGGAKADRYEQMASLPYKVRIFGTVVSDPYKVWAGFINTTSAINKALSKAKCVINIPQFFENYIGHDYYFEGLEKMGFYEYPSRIPQYAAMGLPILNFGVNQRLSTFPECIPCPDRASALDILDGLMNDPQALKELSIQTYQRYKSSFSAISRAVLLNEIIKSPQEYLKLSIHDKAEHFAYILEDHPDLKPKEILLPVAPSNINNGFFPVLNNIGETRRSLRTTIIESPHKWRILYIGCEVYGEAGAVASARRALGNLGHAVYNLDLSREPRFVTHYAENNESVIDLNALEPFIQQIIPEIIVCNGEGLVFSEEDSLRLKSRGILLLGLSLTGLPEDLESYASRFDFIGTASPKALENAQTNKQKSVLLFPFGIDQSFVSLSIEKDKKRFKPVPIIDPCGQDELKDLLIYQLTEELGLSYMSKAISSGESASSEAKWVEKLLNSKVQVYTSPFSKDGDYVSFDFFRSVGTAAAVFVKRTPDMEPFFDQDTEVIGYDDEKEFKNRMFEVRKAHYFYTSFQKRGYQKLAAQNLFEHRWLDFFKNIENDIAQPEILSSQRALQLTPLLNANAVCYKNCVLEGFDTGNDDFLYLEALRKDLSPYHILISPQNLNKQPIRLTHAGKTLSYAFFKWPSPEQSVREQRKQIYSTIISMMNYHKVGISCILLDFNYQGLSDIELKQILILIDRVVKSVSINDSPTWQMIQENKKWVGKTVNNIHNLTFTLELGKFQINQNVQELAKAHSILTVDFRGINGSHRNINMVSALKNMVHESSTQPWAIVGILNDRNSEEQERLETLLNAEKPIPHIFVFPGNSSEEWAGILKSSQALISFHLTPIILAHRLDIPALGISDSASVKTHFVEIGLKECCLPTNFTSDEFTLQFKKIIKNKRLPAEALARIREIEELAQKEIIDFMEYLYKLNSSKGIVPMSNTPSTVEESTLLSHRLLKKSTHLPGFLSKMIGLIILFECRIILSRYGAWIDKFKIRARKFSTRSLINPFKKKTTRILNRFTAKKSEKSELQTEKQE